MTATCQLCGTVIRGKESPPELHIFGRTEADDRATAVQEFDQLAGRVAEHIANTHQQQAEEMTAVAFLAGKVYAMTHAESVVTPDWDGLRTEWRSTILAAMMPSQAAEAPGFELTSSGELSG